MRRSDYDVTDSIRTTDPQAVGSEVFRIYRGLYNGTPVPELERAFPDHAALYGGRHPDYREEDGQRVMKQSEITVRVDLHRGDAASIVWTCDLSHDYVSINADYRS